MKKILPYILITIFSILITGILAPKIDFLTKKETRELRKQNKNLTKENKKLEEDIENHLENAYKWEQIAQQRKDSINIKEEQLKNSRFYNKIIRSKIDSLNIDLNISDSTLTQIDKQIYETINNTDNVSVDEYHKFFTKWLRDRKQNK